MSNERRIPAREETEVFVNEGGNISIRQTKEFALFGQTGAGKFGRGSGPDLVFVV